MCRLVMLAIMSVAQPILAQADELADLCRTQQFTQADPWTPQPKWLSQALHPDGRRIIASATARNLATILRPDESAPEPFAGLSVPSRLRT